MDVVTLALFLIGGVLLIAGAETLVRGASNLASILGLSPLVIGLTVVAYGTSAPELAVTVLSRLQERQDVGVGNIVGSNIFNVLLVLGLSALVAPLVVSVRLVRIEVPLLIAASVLVLLMSPNGLISTREGWILFGAAIGYTLFLIVEARMTRGGNGEDRQPGGPNPAVSVVMVLGGLGMLVLGSHWLVGGATELAEELGLSELIIGLTVVAAGTSFPELATSIVASLRGQRDIAVGNVIGSCIFNLLAVLGLAAIVAPVGIEVSSAARNFDMPVMTAVAIACLPIFFTGQLVARWEGGLFFGYWAAYVLYLFLDATGHDALEPYSIVMLAFVLPITVFTLAYLLVGAIRERMARPPRREAAT